MLLQQYFQGGSVGLLHVVFINIKLHTFCLV